MIEGSAYLPASDLGVSETVRVAMIALARDLANDAVVDFDLRVWDRCIAGHLTRMTGEDMAALSMRNHDMLALFMGFSRLYGHQSVALDRSQPECAAAIYNFLTGVRVEA